LETTIEYAVAMTQKDMINEDYILHTKGSATDGGKGGLGRERQDVPDERLRPLKNARDAFERDYLVQVLAMTEGNITQAAKLAGKYRADFYDLLKKHDLKVEDFKRTKTSLPN
jgi:two-component system response regulator GlrR